MNWSVWAETNWRTALAFILLVGLALRVVWALVIPVAPVSDSEAYHIFATNIAEHGVFGWTPEEPGAYWAVGTPAVIAGLYMLFGQDFTPVVILNIVISVTVIAQIFVLARQYAGPLVGLLAGLLMALWPSMIMYVSILASEVFFICLMLGGLIAYNAAWRIPWHGWVVTGLFWAGATYIRPIALLLPILLGIVVLLRGERRLGPTLASTIVILLIMALCIAPWTYRNHTVFGKPVLISTNFGPNFWMGNNPETTGGYQPLPDWTQGLSETERADRLKAEALAYVQAEPAAFAQRTVVKFFRLHERETIAVAWNEAQILERLGGTAATGLKLLATGYWYMILAMALLGGWGLVRSTGWWRMLTHPMFLGWMYIAWVHAIIVVGDRYHIPAIPFLAVLAAFGLHGVAQARKDRAQT